jgi:hypothetical protein
MARPIRGRRNVIFTITVFVAGFTIANCVFAEEPVIVQRAPLSLIVRALEAHDLLSAAEERQIGGAERRLTSSVADVTLNDLREKLERFPFRNFNLVTAHKRELGLHEREMLDLGEGQKLFVKFLGHKDRRVCLWMRWDDNGMEVLDTRMHLNIGESVLTGTERARNSSLILAVDVEPTR